MVRNTPSSGIISISNYAPSYKNTLPSQIIVDSHILTTYAEIESNIGFQ